MAMETLSLTTIVRRRDEMLANDLSETETVMLDIQRGTYFGVQEVGKAIWDQLQAPSTLQDICEQLMVEFEVDPSTCHEQVEAFLIDLLEHQLIEVQGDASAP
jgi:hypothetical protein